MGEMAEAMLEGIFCQGCGEYMGDGDGYPVFCGGCQRHNDGDPTPDRTEAINASLRLTFECGGRRGLRRFQIIIEAAALGRSVHWNDAPKLHGKLLGRGYITRDKDDKLRPSAWGLERYRLVHGD